VPPAGIDRFLVVLEIVLAVATFVALRWIDAPYGRYSRGGWGPTVSARVGWLVMESPAPLLFAAVFATGVNRGEPVPLALAALWQIHYVYRAFVYPFLLRPGARIPVTVMLLAITFNLLNGWINARWVATFSDYDTSWFADPRFLLGVLLFAGGLALHATSDRALRHLRASGTGYRVPRGGAFDYVSCPNYLGEIVEWTGWALATWSLAGLAFALYTTANLAPRALAHHGWYREHFPDYPPARRALIPFVL
jgi:3-oxo-5-alpha-steroid 4-dehydrogenase 1